MQTNTLLLLLRRARANFLSISLMLLIMGLYSGLTAQNFMMQGWYWDYPKPGCNSYSGPSLSADMATRALAQKNAGFTMMWLPPMSKASFGDCSNGYDPKDLYDYGQITGQTGLGTGAEVQAWLAALAANNILPVADVVYNHRDGGDWEDNPAVRSYILNYPTGAGCTGFPATPYPVNGKMRYRIPLGGSSPNGAGAYYFKFSSASSNPGFNGKNYKLYFRTQNTVHNPAPINEVEPNGGGDCGEPNNQVFLGRDVFATQEVGGGCNTDEFYLQLNTGDFLASGDFLEIYIEQVGGDGTGIDQRIYGIWSAPRSMDIMVDLAVQTRTNFNSQPSGLGGMHFRHFKPNGLNPTCMTGDEEFPFFFFDVEQAYDGSMGGQSTRVVYDAWNKWLWNSVGIRGFRMDAVKHFPAWFVGQLLNDLHAAGINPPMVVGEHFTVSAAALKNWIDAVYAAMTPSAASAIQVRAFDFELRAALKQACDNGLYDTRNIFQSGLVDGAGMSGLNAVTFINNHDYRTPGEHILNRMMLAYAYILTNNRIGIPSVFHPDYYGVNIYGPSHPIPSLETEIDQLMQVHKNHITGAPTVHYLNRFGTTYNSVYLQSGPFDLLLYQIQGGPSGKDVIVAINFENQRLRVNHQINTSNAPLGTQFNLIAGQSNFNNPVVENSPNGVPNSLYIDLPAYSYAVFLQGSPIVTCYADQDGDGFGDPNTSQTFPGTCGSGYVSNNTDGCPFDPNKTAPGACGCGQADVDSDNDGLLNCFDNCPNTPNTTIRPITVDGSISDFGPAIANGANGVNYYFSADNTYFYVGVTGVNLANDNIHIAFRNNDGSTTAANWGVNFNAAPYTYLITFFASNNICYYPFNTPYTCQQVGTGANAWQHFAGWSGNQTSEIRIPRSWLGSLNTGSGTVQISIWANNNAGNFVWSTYPTNNPTGAANVNWINHGQQAYPTYLPQTDTDGDGAGDACDGCPTDPNKTAPGACGCGVADTDTDNDGTPDCNDLCPTDPNKTAPGACGCGVADTDTDNDGTPDCNDLCPTDPNKTAPGACGCGVADTDTDNDGTPDCNDLCPTDPNKTAPGACGCGVADTDMDNDGTPDCNDLCPTDPNKTAPGACGCGVADTDTDNDGTPDCNDLCPTDPNKTAPGACGCGVADTDTDNDGTPDCNDLCPTDPNKTAPGACGCGVADTDTDNDGTPDCNDLCPTDPNKTAPGACGCGVADTDTDNDGTPDCNDLCPTDPNKTAPGTCGCGVADTDTDNDGTPDCNDLCPTDPNKTAPGACGCGVADTDTDNDGTPDCNDLCPTDPNKTAPGACGCGVADTDTDNDGTPDCNDLCPTDPNKTAPGACGCGVADTDTDNDGTPDCNDLCPTDPNKTAPGACGCGVADIDTDNDGTPDCNDLCPTDPNKTAPGACGCGVADTDTDNDGTPDCNDLCPTDPNKTAPGACGCGVADTDTDNDGTPDCNDLCPTDPNKTAPGACGCGVADTDTDNDGTPDCNDLCPTDPNKTAPGACGCGVADTDTDNDGTPDCNDLCPTDPNKTAPGICGCGTPDNLFTAWYLDSDGDGYYTGVPVLSCFSPGAGYVNTVVGGGDCNDSNSNINPGAAEVCGNGIDDNCNGNVDEGCCDLAIHNTSAAAPTCPGGNNGSLSATATSSAMPITYSISGPVSQSNQTGTFAGLPAGIYMLTVSDAANCTATASVTVPAGVDNTPPTISCQNVAVTFNGESSITLVATSLVNASDNCGIASISLSPSVILCSQVGQTVPVTVTVTDVNNNVSTCTANVTAGGLPCGWSHTSGAIGCPSTSDFQPGTGTWTQTATNCLYGTPFTADAMSITQRTLCGNGSITVRVTGITPPGSGWAGIVMRESNAPGARKIQLMTNLSNFYRREVRTVVNGAATIQQLPANGHYWLRIVRTGNQFVAYTSPNGVAWFFGMAVNMDLPNCILMGLVTTNINAVGTTTATFDNVSTSGNSAPLMAPGSPVPALQPQMADLPDFSLYPNPSSGEVTLELSKYIGRAVRVEVYSIEGRLLHFQEIDEVQTAVAQLNLSGYAAGMYLVKVKSKGLPERAVRMVVR